MRRTAHPRHTDRLPWWLAGALGVVSVVLGAVLAVRPFASLGALVVLLAVGLVLTGVLHLLGGRGEGAASRLVGVAWVSAGVAVLVLPGLSIIAVMLIVAVGLVVSGLVRIAGLRRGDRDDRPIGVLLGAASVVLGVLALSWPDVTVLAVAAVFGVQLVLFGVDRSQQAWRRRPGAPTPMPTAPGPRRRWWRTVGAAAALLGAVGLLLLGLRLSGTPRPDAFYEAPAEVPAEPGQLLAAEPFSRDIPAGATGWRILHTTTAGDGTPAVASALVVVPDVPAEAVIAWAHGTTGYATGCAPSLLEHPFEAGAFPDLAGTLSRGWAVVATDYPGLGTAGSHPYLVGQPAGRAVLDAVRAAQQLEDADLPGSTVVWGHSQGGHAALWAGGLAAIYAPELDLAGIAAMAPAANLPALLGDLATSPIGGLFGSFVIAAYSDAYDDVRFRDYVRPGALIGVQEMAGRCLTDPSTLVSVATSILGDQPVWRGDPAQGALLDRSTENVPVLRIGAPLLLAQGASDTLVTPEAQEAYAAARCAEGQDLEYRSYPGLDHMGLVTGDSRMLPDLVAWTSARLAGEPTVTTC